MNALIRCAAVRFSIAGSLFDQPWSVYSSR